MGSCHQKHLYQDSGKEFLTQFKTYMVQQLLVSKFV